MALLVLRIPARGGNGLRDSVEVGIDGDVPGVKQPFGDVAAVSIAQAPVTEFSRCDVHLRRQS